MKGKTKSILALLGTLVIGMVLGGLISGHLIRSRIHHFRELREPGGFRRHLMQVIEPTAQQEPKVRAILDEFGEHMHAIHMKHMEELKENLTILRESLDIYLEDEQMDRVEQALKRMHGRKKHRFRHRSGHRH